MKRLLVSLRLTALLICVFFIVMPAAAGVRIASWNLKHLGWQNDKDLEAVATVIERFDLVAIQEVMKPAEAKRLAAMVSRKSGDEWGVTVSQSVGDSSYKESYAFLWRKAAVTNTGGTTLYLDPGNQFAREPLSSQFTVTIDGRPVDLTLATVHIVYGDHKSDRRDEIRYLDDYWQWLGQTFEGERILLGDFNVTPDDISWQHFDQLVKPAITTGASTLSSDGYANLYDNIWTDGSLPITARGIGDYPQWLGLDHKTAHSRVSDHAPVYIVLGSDHVDTTVQPGLVTDESPETECVDLNQAPADALDRLDHVGPSRAQAIIDGRPWQRIDQLTRISGLSSARVDDIEESDVVCPLSP